MENDDVKEVREKKVNDAMREVTDFILGDWERAEGFAGALANHVSGKSRSAGVEEKARKVFEESIGSTASYGDGVDWENVALYFLYAGYVDNLWQA